MTEAETIKQQQDILPRTSRPRFRREKEEKFVQ